MTSSFATPQNLTQWSWLVMRGNRREYFCPPELTVTIEEFGAELASALTENGLPASAKLVDVAWDDSDTSQRRILVKHADAASPLGIVNLLIGVDQMGRFVYVETKECLQPPVLPKPPKEPRRSEFDEEGCVMPLVGAVVVGIIIAAFGGGATAVGMLVVLAAVAGLAWIWKERYDVSQWNREAQSEQSAWDSAWEEWGKSRLRVAYLSRTDDVHGRFSAAVNSTVDQVAKKLLVDRNAELRKETEELRKQEEIEEEMEKRRKQAMA